MSLSLASANQYDGYTVFRASWVDPIVSETVESILAASPTMNIWAPERLDMVHDTKQVDFMIASEEVDNVRHLFELNTVQVETMIEDAGKLIDQQASRPIQSR